MPRARARVVVCDLRRVRRETKSVWRVVVDGGPVGSALVLLEGDVRVRIVF